MKVHDLSRFRLGLATLIILALGAACSSPRVVDLADGVAVGASGAAQPSSEPMAGEESDFILGVGDSISVKVWRNDDLSRVLRVDPSGHVSFPLIGRIHAEGMAVSAFRQTLVDRLREKYLVNPQVDVGVEEVRSRKIFVLGEVGNPGALTLDARITPWEAIAHAGGFTADANRTRLLLVRNDNGLTRAEAVDVSRVFKGGETRRTFLRDRDILYILPSRVASIERFMVRLGNIVSPIVGVESAVILSREANDVLTGTETKGTSIVVPK